ncbi:glyoxalase [Luteibacter rhizovicinus DSM 16549]|uniref:Glyoxalase n=1 Tax=Luteibacter rhizovicinus DSM 16549 TaxID=1440763 RepID=A0A1L3F020_9GAMM|nr:VOC family protein [Luteibacter rhizovicinus]APG06610.1 glyoxalase [Luteibacter rhizovicinus DSM 16549]
MSASESPRPLPFDMTLEIVVVPVTDVDRAKQFYAKLGWRLDADFPAPDGFRVVQFTPPGSGCSVMMGSNITTASPGSARALHLVVRDLEAARAELVSRGVDVSEPFHDATGIFHRADGSRDVAGPHPERKSYGSFARFNDPDGNEWFMQEITQRLPGR